MRGTLVLSILSVQSSYLLDLEQDIDATGVPDTIQWWIAETGSWRIRTFGLDHDIHTHSLGEMGDIIDLAMANDRKHYGDIIQAQHALEFDTTVANEFIERFQAAGLPPRIEIAEGQFAFWKPDDARYFTQSSPG